MAQGEITKEFGIFESDSKKKIMIPQFTVITNLKEPYGLQVDRYPDECPYCHKGLEANYLSGYLNSLDGNLTLSFSCPRINCGKFFLATYLRHNPSQFIYNRTLLGYFMKQVFSPAITRISSNFVKIYNQAEVAEEQLLDQICGPGYRKALEFLIKDYIISRKLNLKESVEKKPLGNCINDHIENENIKALSKRATWIGNDEVHYVRIWVGKDITDLKSLINLSVHWIDTEILTEELIKSMPEVSKTAP